MPVEKGSGRLAADGMTITTSRLSIELSFGNLRSRRKEETRHADSRPHRRRTRRPCCRNLAAHRARPLPPRPTPRSLDRAALRPSPPLARSTCWKTYPPGSNGCCRCALGSICARSQGCIRRGANARERGYSPFSTSPAAPHGSAPAQQPRAEPSSLACPDKTPRHAPFGSASTSARIAR